jgi:hypothetical protein
LSASSKSVPVRRTSSVTARLPVGRQTSAGKGGIHDAIDGENAQTIAVGPGHRRAEHPDADAVSGEVGDRVGGVRRERDHRAPSRCRARSVEGGADARAGRHAHTAMRREMPDMYVILAGGGCAGEDHGGHTLTHHRE